MKKLFILLAAVVAVGFSSCTKDAAEPVAPETKAVPDYVAQADIRPTMLSRVLPNRDVEFYVEFYLYGLGTPIKVDYLPCPMKITANMYLHLPTGHTIGVETKTVTVPQGSGTYAFPVQTMYQGTYSWQISSYSKVL